METYLHSAAVKKLQDARDQGRPLRLAFFDIDDTWTGTPADQQTVRDLLEARHYVIVQVTNRGSDLCLTSLVDPRSKAALQGLLDPDILAAASGTELFVKQATGTYQVDEEYLRKLPASIQDWQAKIWQLGRRSEASGHSFITHYLDLPVFRVELECDTHNTAEKLESHVAGDPAAKTLHIARDRKTVIITPANFSKEDAVERIIAALCSTLSVSPDELHVLVAGDSAADVAMGLKSGPKTQATFVIPASASLTEELRSGKFLPLYQQMTKTKENSTLPTGVYWFPQTARKIVLGDEAFPGTKGPTTLGAWLNSTA